MLIGTTQVTVEAWRIWHTSLCRIRSSCGLLIFCEDFPTGRFKESAHLEISRAGYTSSVCWCAIISCRMDEDNIRCQIAVDRISASVSRWMTQRDHRYSGIDGLNLTSSFPCSLFLVSSGIFLDIFVAASWGQRASAS